MPADQNTKWNGMIVRLRSADESAMFPTLVFEALDKIASKPTGKKLLNGIKKYEARKLFGYTVCIMRPANLSYKDVGDGTGPKWSSGSVCLRISEANATNGTGSPSQVIWNANIIETPDGARPSFISLAHELIHAYYNLKGSAFKDTSEEEYCTVGLAPLAGKRSITENKIRAEHGLSRRAAYSGLNPPVINSSIMSKEE